MNRWWAGPIAISVFWLSAAAGFAGLTRQEIEGVGARPEIGVELPLDARFATRTGETLSLGRAIAGRPALLVFADLTCTTLCGVTLGTVAGALRALSRKPGHDYSLVVASIDPKDGPADAARMASAQLGDGAIAGAARFLTGSGVDRLADAAGFTYVHDAENDAYAHPVGIYVLGPDGRIARYLPGLRVQPADLALALDEAGAGTTTPVASTLLLMCYRFDPETGVYTPAITRIMTVAGTAMVVFVAAGVGFLLRRERRGASSGGRG